MTVAVPGNQYQRDKMVVSANRMESEDESMGNLALLHRTCNGIKRNRMTLAELRNHNAMNGLLYV